MPSPSTTVTVVSLVFGLTLNGFGETEKAHPLPSKRRAALDKRLGDEIRVLSTRIERDPANVRLYMQRGSSYFFRARFEESVADFDRTIELEPQRRTSHWQRGISLYYAGQYDKSAQQFEAYHTFDNVDRENGIWRFLAQTKAKGIQQARNGLLQYTKDDREPFRDIYSMFAGDLTGDRVLQNIRNAEISNAERDKRLFYANLYVGLYAHARGDLRSATEHLRAAVANGWGQSAGGGPGYMWHVARVHYDLLLRKDTRSTPPPNKVSN